MIFCSLYSGSSGNSIFIGDKESKILIDAGMPGKKIDEAMKSIGQDPSKLDGIFITHEHSDHIKGVGIISRKYDVPIYANDKTWAAMESSIGKVKEHNIKVMDRRTSVDIGSLNIKSFIIPHDAISPVGYTVSNGIKQVSVATDFGVFTEEIYSNVKDSEVILLESNHDVNMLKFGPYPYSLNGFGKKVMLGHLSNTNNHPDLAYQTVLNVIKDKGLKQGEDVILSMASRKEPSGYIEL